MSFISKILNRFGYYHLEPRQFYFTDEAGKPCRYKAKIGDNFYVGYSTRQSLNKQIDKILKDSKRR